jgi:cytochrome c oxidase assembly protein subunit 15
VTSTPKLPRSALVATILLVGVGAYTRGSGSGFGCADRWPLCEDGLLGGLLPRPEFHMVVEWSHRWLAAVVGILVILTAVAAYRSRPRNPKAVWPAAAAVIVVGIQAWLGRQIVTSGLDRDLVSLHLTVSMMVVGLLVLTVVATGSPESSSGRVWPPATAAALVFAVLLLGSMVHNVYIEGWPLVRGDLVPDLSIRLVALHWGHRLAAAVGFALVGYLYWRAPSRTGPFRKALAIALAAYLINVAIGAAHVFTEVSSSLLVGLHVIVAAVAWAALVAATALAAHWGSRPSTA